MGSGKTDHNLVCVLVRVVSDLVEPLLPGLVLVLFLLLLRHQVVQPLEVLLGEQPGTEVHQLADSNQCQDLQRKETTSVAFRVHQSIE